MQSSRTIGLFLVGSGCGLPVLTYGVSHVLLALEAAKGGPPNQGAMVLAYLALVASFGIGILMIVAGAIVYATSFWQKRKQPMASSQF